MKVNGKDVLETYGLKQWNVEMAYGEIGNESSWEDGCPVPVLLESNFGLKKIKVSVLAKGENRDEIWGKTGKLLAEVVIGYLEEGHSSNIAKFSFADSIEQLKFDARTGEIWEKQMAGELERAATLEQIEVYQLPVIRCGTEKLCAWINGSTTEADISIAFDEMYL